MTKTELVQLMKFPKEWVEWNMLPDELIEIQIKGYKPGHENGSEHNRNGAFHWWLKNNPSKEQLVKLVKLTYLEPDRLMGEDVRSYIRKSKNYRPDIESKVNAT